MRLFSRPAEPDPLDLCLLLVATQPQASVLRVRGDLLVRRNQVTSRQTIREFFLGEDATGTPLWVLVLPPETDGCLPLRLVLANLQEPEAGLVTRAVTYAHWLAQHRFCGVCGRPLERRLDEFVLACPVCQSEVFPRISPCVIMLVHRGDQVLLARHRRSPRPVFSCLAGYVEAGETLEQAVAREVHEEVGVRVGPPVYCESQPWPFPSQIMAGFLAPWVSGEPVPDGDEILEAGWFRRDHLPDLPPELSLARRLVRQFFHDPEL